MGKRRSRDKKNYRMEPSTNPEAELITVFGKVNIPSHQAHFSVDRRKRVTLAVDGSKATDDDMSKVHSLFTSSVFASDQKPKIIVADGHYGGIEALKYYQDQYVQTWINPQIMLGYCELRENMSNARLLPPFPGRFSCC